MELNRWVMGIAEAVAPRSKDPNTKVGAVIIDRRSRIVSVGYNGFPRACDDDPSIYDDRTLKHLRVMHAEANAIMFANTDLTNHHLYCTLMPCARCAAMIIQSGIDKVVAKVDDERLLADEDTRRSHTEALRLFKEAGVRLQQYVGDSSENGPSVTSYGRYERVRTHRDRRYEEAEANPREGLRQADQPPVEHDVGEYPSPFVGHIEVFGGSPQLRAPRAMRVDGAGRQVWRGIDNQADGYMASEAGTLCSDREETGRERGRRDARPQAGFSAGSGAVGVGTEEPAGSAHTHTVGEASAIDPGGPIDRQADQACDGQEPNEADAGDCCVGTSTENTA